MAGAALELADGDFDEAVFGVQLLRDIRDVFEAHDLKRVQRPGQGFEQRCTVHRLR